MKEGDDLVLFDGDMMITKAQRRSIMSDVALHSALEGGRWTDGIIPYEIVDSTNTENTSNYRFRDYDETQLKTIKAAINAFNALPTCVKFVEREEHHEYYIEIINMLEYNSTAKIWEEGGCYAYLGRMYYAKHGRNPHPDPDHQKINLAAWCLETSHDWDGIGT